MITGAGILLAGIIIGIAIRSIPWRHSRNSGDRPPELRCGCKHHYSFHDAQTGACHAHDDHRGGICKCRQYTGPEPLPEYVPREIG